MLVGILLAVRNPEHVRSPDLAGPVAVVPHDIKGPTQVHGVVESYCLRVVAKERLPWVPSWAATSL
jgi:hypothetical protein